MVKIIKNQSKTALKWLKSKKPEIIEICKIKTFITVFDWQNAHWNQTQCHPSVKKCGTDIHPATGQCNPPPEVFGLTSMCYGWALIVVGTICIAQTIFFSRILVICNTQFRRFEDQQSDRARLSNWPTAAKRLEKNAKQISPYAHIANYKVMGKLGQKMYFI